VSVVPRAPWIERVAALLALFLIALALVDALAREGVRVGALRPSALPVAVFVLAPLALGLALPSPAARRAAVMAAGLISALLLLWTLQATRWPAGGESGTLRAHVRSLSVPGVEHSASVRFDRLRTPAGFAEALGRNSDMDLQLDGQLELPESGSFQFRLACGGTCALSLGERELVRGRGRIAVEAELTAGVVPLHLTLQQPAGRAFLALDWDRPVFIETGRLADALTVQPASPGALAGRVPRILARVLGQAVAAAAGVLLAITLLRSWRLALPAQIQALRGLAADGARRRALGLGLGATLFLGALHLWISPRALAGGYLHPWTSEYMMQTVSLADLRVEPLNSLFYLHIQPPLFDALRALLANVVAGAQEGTQLVGAVDHALYVCWGLAYGACIALMYVFLARAAGGTTALVCALLFAVHPATLFYATFLDSTFLSALLVLWLGYELWRMGPLGQGSEIRLVVAVLALFFTRSLVQWPFVPLLALVLWLRGCERRRIARALAVIALVMGLYLIKQYALFGLTITSSFGPDSFCKGLSAYCQGTTPVVLPHALPAPAAASVLRRTEKLGGEYNYNQLAFLRRSFSQMQEYRELLRQLSPRVLLNLMAHNLELWLQPSSRHSPHVLVDALPWRAAFDCVMSGPVLALLLGLASLVWLRTAWGSRAALAGGLGLALPVLYFAATAIVFESGENMRYKFFVEPLLFVFLAVQLRTALTHWPVRRKAT
jgi:hypothetical protein